MTKESTSETAIRATAPRQDERHGKNSTFRVLREVPAFRLLVSGQIVSQLGDALNELALMWLVLELTGSALKMGLVMIAFMVPMILFSLPAGAMVDRWDRRRVMIASDLVRVAIVGSIPFMAALGLLRFESLLVVSFLMAAVSVFFGPAKTAYLQLIIPRDLLLPANGLSQMGWQAAYLVGPALGGMAVAWMGAANVIILDAVSFLVSAALITAIRIPGRAPNSEAGHERGRMWSDITQGLRFLFQQKAFFYMMIFAWVVNFTAAPMSVLTPLFVKDILRQGPSAFGFLNAAMSAGMLLGGLGVGGLRAWKRTTLIFGGIVGMGAGFAAFAAAGVLWQAMAAFVVIGVMNAITNVTFGTLMQEIVPNEKMGRVNSAVNAGFMAASPLSLAMSGFLADNVPLRLLYLGMAVIFLASGFAGLRIREFRSFNVADGASLRAEPEAAQAIRTPKRA